MRILVLSISLFAMACGGGDDADSGVDSDKRVAELSESEVRDVCEAGIEAQGGEGTTHDCGDGVTAEVGTVDECVADYQDFPSDCELTVGELEACVNDWDDLCGDPPPSCQPLFECFF